MVLLRSCCLCIAPQTAAVALASMSILLSGVLLAPLSVFLEHHSYYITQFARIQREMGNYMDDDQVPEIVVFSKVLYSILLAVDVTYIFSCILLLAGVAAKKHVLMVPWLVYMFTAILVLITIVISFIIALEDYLSLGVFLGSSPVILLSIYIWLVVASAYQIIRRESVPVGGGPTTSASQSSLVSIKEGLQRVLGGTPPPPYEAVTTEAGSPKRAGKYSRQVSAESETSDTMFFDISSTRRSSEEAPSTKPASPVPLQLQTKLNGGPHERQTAQCTGKPDYESMFKRSSRINSSVSQSNLCTRQSPKIEMRKSSSSYQHFTQQLNQVKPLHSAKSQSSHTVKDAEMTGMTGGRRRANEDDLMTTCSSLSDETSSMSATSLDFPNPHNILV